MDLKIIAVITAVIAVVGASGEQRIMAGIIAAAFLVCTFLRFQNEKRILLLSATGFPLVFTAGFPIVAGLLVTCVVLTLLTASGTKISIRVILAAAAAGVAGGIWAFQLSTALSILASGIFAVIVIYIIFIREYRLKEEVERPSK